MRKDQRGFSAVETLLVLILVILVGFVGWYVGNASDKSHDSLNNADKSSDVGANVDEKQASKATTPQASDKDQIIAAVKAHNPEATDIEVNVQEIKGNFARGGAGSEEGGGFSFIAKKENGKWSVVFQGQEAASKADGEKYGMPEDWYTTEY